MNLTFLRYAVEVEKTGSISLAARNLYLGQPNVSKAIKGLESTLGITIFKRTPRGVIPTPKGEEFLYYAKNILSQMDSLENMFREEKADRVSFHIAAPRAAYITQAFAEFAGALDSRKGMDMALYEAGAAETIERVAQQEYNMGIIRYDIAHEEHFQQLLGSKGLVSKPLWEMNSLLLVGRHHPLAKEQAVDIRQLEDGVELIFGGCDAPFSAGEARGSVTAEAQRRRIRLYSLDSAWELLRSVRGAYMWSSPVSAAQLQGNDCVQRSVNGAPMLKDVLIHPREYRFRDADKQFIATLNRVKDTLAWQHYR